MENLSVHEIQADITSVLEKMEKQGKSFLIFRDGKPIADLVPHKTKENLSASSEQSEKSLRSIRKAAMPEVKVRGKKLSEIIIEDRR